MTNPKRDRFSRLFPDRAKKLLKSLEVLENCSNKSNYEFNEDLVQRCWVEIGKQFEQVAQSFDIDLHITLDGKGLKAYDTSKPLEDQ